MEEGKNWKKKLIYSPRNRAVKKTAAWNEFTKNFVIVSRPIMPPFTGYKKIQIC